MSDYDIVVASDEAPPKFDVDPAQADAAPTRTERRGELLADTGIVELLLKHQAELDRRLRTEQDQAELVPRLLAVAVGGLALYGIVATILLNMARERSGFWLPGLPPAYWNQPSVGNLAVAYSVGLLAACGICLPSFYFYGLLAGVRMTMLAAAAHALKGAAASAVALVGILPIYVALALNALLFSRDPAWLTVLSALALLLPFVAGLWGVYCLNRGFLMLADTIPAERRCRRACLLRRLTWAWSGCFTFVTPLVIYTLWQQLAAATS